MMMNWSDGYVADIDYPAAFFPEQGPDHLNIACILNGVEPLPPGRPFTYFELGAGMGLTANILAASHPHGRFFANDFNPAHVASARQLADEAQLENMTQLECSFADLAAGAVDLPPLDYITMYGVLQLDHAGQPRQRGGFHPPLPEAGRHRLRELQRHARLEQNPAAAAAAARPCEQLPGAARAATAAGACAGAAAGPGRRRLLRRQPATGAKHGVAGPGQGGLSGA
ncbi:class I SAM-dependent methyltransferase [Massilia sp. MB5]|uniref:class I SAM-dependent methyltransferase n=1 Tax=Massilia sp. MB5 TaxID=2919578 RepID=UPI001F0D144D|nr:class I SAM-dependent methyltransferase [Massilia sp. MB5]UMR32242.1 class I SAM-dependent methyltransferase [Massilia sp. MB5]